MSSRQLVLLIIVVGTAIRLALAAATGLGMDESYTVGNARQLALGYVDHAPLHLWLAGIASRLFGSEAAIFVRLPFILLFAGTTWLMFRLTERLFGDKAGLWAAGALSIVPVFTLAHGSWVLPDGPAIFFMLATANVVAAILFAEPQVRRPLLWWLAAGALGGLAILSKYNAAFIFVGVLAYVLTVPSARRLLARPGPWLATLVALVIFSPAVFWNAEHGLVGYFFQSRRVGGLQNLRLDWVAEDIGGQALYLSPWLFFPFAISLVRALIAGRREPRGWLVALIAVGPIATFTFFALWSHGLPHWQMPGWIFAIPLFGRDSANLVLQRPSFARRYMLVSAGLFAVLMVLFSYQAVSGALIPHTLGPAADPTLDLLDWRDLHPELEARGLLGADPVVASPIWMYAGKASYALGPDIPVVCVCDDAQQFAFRYDQTRWTGRDMVVIVADGNTDWMWHVAARYFDRFDPLPPIMIMRAGAPALKLNLAMGRNLHFPPKPGG